MAGDVLRAHVKQVVVVEGDGARAWLVHPTDDVEHGGLACTIGSDETQDLTLVDVEREAVEGHDSTEADGDVTYFQKRHAGSNRGLAAVVPRGVHSTPDLM